MRCETSLKSEIGWRTPHQPCQDFLTTAYCPRFFHLTFFPSLSLRVQLKPEQKATECIYQKCVPLLWVLRCYLHGHLHKAALLKGQPYYFQWNQAPSDLKALAHDLESMLLTFCLISHLSSFWIIPTQTLAALKFPKRPPSLCIGQCPALKKEYANIQNLKHRKQSDH